MKIRFNHLSSGYIGKNHKNGTLNSKYFSEFFNKIVNSNEFLSNLILFPQRIPKLGFFKELIALETTDFTVSFKNLLDTIKNKYNKAKDNYIKNSTKENTRTYINWANVLLRFGCFNEISTGSPQALNEPYSLEIEIIKETSKIETHLSNNTPFFINEFLEIYKKFTNNFVATEREKIILLNRIIVYFYRHQKQGNIKNSVIKLSWELIELLDKLETTSFTNRFNASVAYRGIAMVSELGQEKQSFFLEKAENLARSNHQDTAIEKIVSKDNLYTCLQTMSKWKSFQGNAEGSENCLLEMIEIDPYDSTGYCELGFFYIKTESYNKAATVFKKAMELGPPGTGMNAYYYAKCLEKIGNESEAIKYLHESTTLDKYALSPWLDLLEYYLNKKQTDKAQEIAKNIYQTPDLKEQLEEHEIITIQNLFQ